MSAEPPRPGSAAEAHLGGVRAGLEAAGVDVETVWAAHGRERKVRAIARFQLRGLGRLWHADVVYSRWHVLDVSHVLAARLLGRPIVLEVNGTTDDLVLANPALARLSPVLRRWTAWVFARAAHVIVVSPGLEEWVHDLAPRTSTTYLANGAPRSIPVTSAALDPPFAVFVGELARHQGIHTLLAARRSDAWPTGLGLVVVGGGAEEATVAEAHARGDVDYRGRVARDEAHALLRAAVLSISPQTATLARNRLGITPLKVAESMMAGVPVVGSDLPGMREMIGRAPAGRTVEADVPEALAAAVAAVASEHADPAALRRYAEDELSWEAVARRTVSILEEVRDRRN
ncbi:glycosyltransferase [Oryzobacter sp. R7]|uniref:glycosyltransferase n=1 Tax=Oryzobacter faecalis TaxID=3388656 RepID=UPI00398CAFD8